MFFDFCSWFLVPSFVFLPCNFSYAQSFNFVSNFLINVLRIMFLVLLFLFLISVSFFFLIYYMLNVPILFLFLILFPLTLNPCPKYLILFLFLNNLFIVICTWQFTSVTKHIYWISIVSILLHLSTFTYRPFYKTLPRSSAFVN